MELGELPRRGSGAGFGTGIRRPFRGGSSNHSLSTGFASLHPWLQSVALSGRRSRRLASPPKIAKTSFAKPMATHTHPNRAWLVNLCNAALLVSSAACLAADVAPATAPATRPAVVEETALASVSGYD